MIHRLREAFPNPSAGDMNPALMNFCDEKPLYEYVVDAFKSIHKTLDEIELTDWTFVSDVGEVNQDSYERTRSNRTADKTQKYVYIKESRLGELVMHFTVDLRKNPLAVKKKFLKFTVKQLIPIEKNGCYLLDGVTYPIQCQLTERSTYVTPGSVVCKALMGIMVTKSEKVTARDHLGEVYLLNAWRVNMFSGTANAALFFLSEMSWYDFLHFFQLHTIVDIVETENDFNPKCVYLRIHGNMFLEVNKEFIGMPYVSCMVGTILAAIPPDASMDDILDKKTWISQIGATRKSNATAKSGSKTRDSLKERGNLELGIRNRKLFNRMLDDASIEAYELTMHNKKDILHLIRWLIQEYDLLRAKDNLNILNKRLRRSAVPASLINGVISEKIKRFINASAKTEDQLYDLYKNLFAFKGTEVKSKVRQSGLAEWDDSVNDMNIFNRFKVTMGGPNAIGNKNPKNISAEHKSLNPSHIGILSLDVCSASNPGMSNFINPLCKTDKLQFAERPPEPEEFGYKWRLILDGVEEEEVCLGAVCDICFRDPVRYNNILDIFDDLTIEALQECSASDESTLEDPFKTITVSVAMGREK